MNDIAEPGPPDNRRPPRRLYASNANYAFLVSLFAVGLLVAGLVVGKGDPNGDAGAAVVAPLALLRRAVATGEMFVPLLGLVAILVAWRGVDQIRRRPRFFGRRRAAIAIALGFASIVVPFSVGAALFLSGLIGLSEEKSWAEFVVRAAAPFSLVGFLCLRSLFARPFSVRTSARPPIGRGAPTASPR